MRESSRVKRLVPLLLIALLGLPLAAFTLPGVSPPAAHAVNAAIAPPFGIDMVTPPPPVFEYNATAFTWGRGSDLVTLKIPTMTVAVVTTDCAMAQTGAFSKVNSTTWLWALSGGSVCNGVSIATTMDVYVKNTTDPSTKEIIVTGTTTQSGTSSVTNIVSFPLVLSGALSSCGAYCKNLGWALFNWQQLAGFSPTFTSDNLTVSSGSSSASITTYTFDPLAIDGQNYCYSNANCNISLTTSDANDVLIVSAAVTGLSSCPAVPTSSPSLTFALRTSETFTTDILCEYYAVWSSSGSITITANLGTGGDLSAVGFAVAGADSASPFDSNAAANCVASADSTSVSCSQSTSNANDMLLTLNAIASESLTVTFASGFSGVNSCAVQVNNPQVCDAYEVVSSTQSALSNSASWGATDYAAIIADAIVEAPQVTQPILVATPTGGSAFTYTVSGCSVSPTSATSGSTATDFTASPSCALTVTMPAAGTDTRYEFGPHGVQSEMCNATATCAFASNVAQNDILLVQWFDATKSTDTVSDSLGSTWTCSSSILQPGTTSTYNYFCWAPAKSSGADTITIGNTPGTTYIQMEEWSGLGTTSEGSSTGTSSSSGSTTASVTSFTPSAPSYVVALIRSTGSGPSLTPSAGYNPGIMADGTVDISLDMVSSSSTSSATTASGTLSGTFVWIEWAVAFQAIGSGISTTTTVGTCATGTCATFTPPDWYQVQNTFTVDANAQTDFDTGMSWSVTGTSGGVSGSAVCTISSTAAASDSCSGWSDYDTATTIPQAASNPPADSRWESSAACSNTPTAGGNTYTCQSYKQYSNTFEATPSSPTTWDGAFTLHVTGTYFGTASSTLCTITTVSGGGAATCSAWSDSGATASMPASFADGSTYTWSATTYSFTITSGGNTEDAAYTRTSNGYLVTISTSSFLNNDGSAMQVAVTAYSLQFSNGTTRALAFGTWRLPGGTTTLKSATWEGMQVANTSLTFDPSVTTTPTFNVLVYTLQGLEFAGASQALTSLSYNSNLNQLSFTADCTATAPCEVYTGATTLGQPYYVTEGGVLVTSGATPGWTWNSAGSLATVTQDPTVAYLVSWSPLSTPSPGSSSGSGDTSGSTATTTPSSTTPASTTGSTNSTQSSPTPPANYGPINLGSDFLVLLFGSVAILVAIGAMYKENHLAAWVGGIVGAYLLADFAVGVLATGSALSAFSPLGFAFPDLEALIYPWYLSLGGLGLPLIVVGGAAVAGLPLYWPNIEGWLDTNI